MNLPLLNDESYMRLALQMASQAMGQTGINPVVGCVIVKDGRIAGIGSHLRRGSEHAEIHALRMAGQEAEGSTVYVTLEPCSHYGATPPCCESLIAARVARVVVAAQDPNPQVAGRGIRRLRESGVETVVGLLEQESAAMNEKFNKYIVTGLPFVTLKTASTLDGRIAARTGDSRWISGEESRSRVHTLRHQHQAIMIGAGTALADDPRLTARLPVPALQPLRIVADSSMRLPEHAALVQDQTAPTILLTTERSPADRRRRMEQLGVQVLVCGDGAEVDLPLAMKRIGELELGSILLEGGGRLNGAMLQAGLIDKIILFLAPKIIGGADAPSSFAFAGFDRMDEAIRLDRLSWEPIGSDLCVSGYPIYGR